MTGGAAKVVGISQPFISWWVTVSYRRKAGPLKLLRCTTTSAAITPCSSALPVRLLSPSP